MVGENGKKRGKVWEFSNTGAIGIGHGFFPSLNPLILSIAIASDINARTLTTFKQRFNNVFCGLAK